MEILFIIGKRTDNGEWVEGNLLMKNDGVKTYIHDSPLYIPVIPETIGLFTGRTDKNDIKIFNGSIIRYYAKLLLVEWVDNCLGFRLKTLNRPFKDSFKYDALSILFEKDDIQVIGMIYENKNLLSV